MRQGVRVLGQQPGIGRPIDEMPDEFREWAIDFGDSGYVARYRLDSDVVTMLAVRHQKEVGDWSWPKSGAETLLGTMLDTLKIFQSGYFLGADT
jgi:hypothetical protein